MVRTNRLLDQLLRQPGDIRFGFAVSGLLGWLPREARVLCQNTEHDAVFLSSNQAIIIIIYVIPRDFTRKSNEQPAFGCQLQMPELVCLGEQRKNATLSLNRG